MNSDPGTSGLLSPFAGIDGLYFDPSEEPAEFYYKMIQDLKAKSESDGKIFISCEYDNPNDFYDALKAMQQFVDDNFTVYGTSREGKFDLIINEDSDMDDQTKPQTVALAKKKKKSDDGSKKK